MSWGFMMAVELTTYRVPKDHTPPHQWRDTWCLSRHFTIEDSVCHRIDSSTCFCSIMTWSYTICVRPSWELTLTLTYGTTSFASGSCRVRT
jgi:hypothetical protein